MGRQKLVTRSVKVLHFVTAVSGTYHFVFRHSCDFLFFSYAILYMLMSVNETRLKK